MVNDKWINTVESEAFIKDNKQAYGFHLIFNVTLYSFKRYETYPTNNKMNTHHKPNNKLVH